MHAATVMDATNTFIPEYSLGGKEIFLPIKPRNPIPAVFMMPECKSAKISGAAWRCRIISLSDLTFRPKTSRIFRVNFGGQERIWGEPAGRDSVDASYRDHQASSYVWRRNSGNSWGKKASEVQQTQNCPQHLHILLWDSLCHQLVDVSARRWHGDDEEGFVICTKTGRENSNSCPTQPPKNSYSKSQPQAKQGESPWENSLTLRETLTLAYQRNVPSKERKKPHFKPFWKSFISPLFPSNNFQSAFPLTQSEYFHLEVYLKLKQCLLLMQRS